MAAAATQLPVHHDTNIVVPSINGHDDPFTVDENTPSQQPYVQRYSSRFDVNSSSSPAAASSPSQVKRILEAHLLETERRLQDAQRLGTSLLDQQAALQDKLREVEQQQDETTISAELRKQLESINKEHEETSKEIARSLLAPKSRLVVSSDDSTLAESGMYTSQATGSPTKVTAPSRRQRNQPTNRTPDLQLAVDISTDLLAQVRQLQAAVAERDDTIQNAHTDRLGLEADVQNFSQRLRDLQDHEQRYKDENWNLETQNHELMTTIRESGEKEKKMNSTLAITLAEKSRLQSDMEEAGLAHSKREEEHSVARKAHETELHSLKRDVDAGDTERGMMQSKIDELMSQNQELARAMAGKFRNLSPHGTPEMPEEEDDVNRDLETPEHSPPPSPTKATPRHGGLESETLRSSLHHAHRMIQNLKGNIHREKTEKIELKRMLQDARDELEQRRSDTGAGNVNRSKKARTETFKKSARSDQLGGSRRARTDIEPENDEWEDNDYDMPGKYVSTGLTDASDAYQTGTETESNFETADERQNTETEAFETGAESLAGDSTDDLTETESTAPHGSRAGAARHSRPSATFRQAGDRNSYLSTASTSADEDDIALQTPGQPSQKFRLKNGRASYARHSQLPYQGTPESISASSTARDSPATVIADQSPAPLGQSLFAELGGFDDASSDRLSTPARSGIEAESTPSRSFLVKPLATPFISTPLRNVVMVDSGMMTEPWAPEPAPIEATPAVQQSISPTIPPPVAIAARPTSASDFPLPPSVPASPLYKIDNSTQYTPQRAMLESPLRNNKPFITPPKTVWDEASELGSPIRDPRVEDRPSTPRAVLDYSQTIMQSTSPVAPKVTEVIVPKLGYSNLSAQTIHPIAPEPTPAPVAIPEVPLSIHEQITDDTRRYSRVKDAGLAAAAVGIVASAATVTALAKPHETHATSLAPEAIEASASSRSITEDAPQSIEREAYRPVSRSHNADATLIEGKPIEYSSNDSSAQTMLTAEQIEAALQPKPVPAFVSAPAIASGTVSSVVPTTPVSDPMARETAVLPPAPRSPPPPPPVMAPPPIPGSKFTEAVHDPLTALPPVASTTSSRPSSSSSLRTSAILTSHPPLPPDYKTNIAKANSTMSLKQTDKANVPGTATVMGPPLMPASAMRRPKTPSETMKIPARDNATPRLSQSSRYPRSTVASQISRRSSVSSFASELDERFNIRHSGQPGYEGGPTTDPRMIQAITQTMIGEYLWKYTRKNISKELSSNRHRRYFWVHPYTKMLYWSTNGPEQGGNKETSNKGVVIESVRVINDDNPMPPGLHRKSLEVSTPGRKIRFTATTGQRHETWFNALSYLLLRGEPGDQTGPYSAGGNEITQDDVDEFNAGGGYNAHLLPNTSRVSMSSYNSRTTGGTSSQRNSRQPLPSNIMSTSKSNRESIQSPIIRASSSTPINNDSQRLSRLEEDQHIIDNDRTLKGKSAARVSKMLGSTSGRSSRVSDSIAEPGQASSSSRNDHHRRRPESGHSVIYDASPMLSARDSAEEARQEMLRQEAAGLNQGHGLENVRACCDGKHDVSTLDHSHSHRASDIGTGARGFTASVGDRISRSVSRRK